MTINSSNNSSNSFVDRFAKNSSTNRNSVSNLVNKTQSENQDKNSISSNETKQSQSILPKSKVDPIKKSQSDLIYLVTGTDRDRPAWYYVLVDRLKVKMFLQAMKSNSINLDDFGTVIYSAYGESPPEEITNKVKEEYGITD